MDNIDMLERTKNIKNVYLKGFTEFIFEDAQ